MGVTVESHNIPQPAQTENVPHNSMPHDENAPTAFRQYLQPRIKTAFENYLPHALAGLGTVAALSAGASFLRNKRRDKIRRERDRQWREDAKALMPVKNL